MKTGIHPQDYQLVIYEDLNNGDQFLTRSTAKSSDTAKWTDGNTYPVIKVHISSTSHPYYTGQEKLMDVEGRVDKFKARQDAAKAKAADKAKRVKAAPKKESINSDEVVAPKTQKIGGLKSAHQSARPAKPRPRPAAAKASEPEAPTK